MEAAEKWAVAEAMVDQQKIKERDEAAGLKLVAPPLPGFTHSLHIYMEVAEYVYIYIFDFVFIFSKLDDNLLHMSSA